MKSIKDILSDFQSEGSNRVTKEFQAFGLEIAQKLGDLPHKSLYIKLAKTTPRVLLDQAMRFAVDSTAKKKGALFMWKLKQLKEEVVNKE